MLEENSSPMVAGTAGASSDGVLDREDGFQMAHKTTISSISSHQMSGAISMISFGAPSEPLARESLTNEQEELVEIPCGLQECPVDTLKVVRYGTVCTKQSIMPQCKHPTALGPDHRLALFGRSGRATPWRERAWPSCPQTLRSIISWNLRRGW